MAESLYRCLVCKGGTLVSHGSKKVTSEERPVQLTIYGLPPSFPHQHLIPEEAPGASYNQQGEYRYTLCECAMAALSNHTDHLQACGFFAKATQGQRVFSIPRRVEQPISQLPPCLCGDVDDNYEPKDPLLSLPGCTCQRTFSRISQWDPRFGNL